MFCYNCGKQLSDEMRFCPFCGKEVYIVNEKNTGDVNQEASFEKEQNESGENFAEFHNEEMHSTTEIPMLNFDALSNLSDNESFVEPQEKDYYNEDLKILNNIIIFENISERYYFLLPEDYKETIAEKYREAKRCMELSSKAGDERANIFLILIKEELNEDLYYEDFAHIDSLYSEFIDCKENKLPIINSMAGYYTALFRILTTDYDDPEDSINRTQSVMELKKFIETFSSSELNGTIRYLFERRFLRAFDIVVGDINYNKYIFKNNYTQFLNEKNSIYLHLVDVFKETVVDFSYESRLYYLSCFIEKYYLPEYSHENTSIILTKTLKEAVDTDECILACTPPFTSDQLIKFKGSPDANQRIVASRLNLICEVIRYFFDICEEGIIEYANKIFCDFDDCLVEFYDVYDEFSDFTEELDDINYEEDEDRELGTCELFEFIEYANREIRFFTLLFDSLETQDLSNQFASYIEPTTHLTALHVAAGMHDDYLMEWLIERGADKKALYLGKYSFLDFYHAYISDDGTLKEMISADEIMYLNELERCREKVSKTKHLIVTEYNKNYGVCSNGTVLAAGEFYEYEFSVPEWRDIKSIATNNSHTVGLKYNGTVVAGGESKFDKRCRVSGWQDIKAISAGKNHTLGLASNGKVYAVGNNDFHQCDVSTWNNVIEIAAGSNHSVGLKKDGTVFAIGSNKNGQCNVSNWINVKKIFVKDNIVVGLKGNGTVYHTGVPEFHSSSEFNVEGWSDIVDISIGDRHIVG